jgi:hypothetical protein
VTSWEELSKGGKTCDGMRWNEVKQAEKTWDELSWDEMGWRRLRRPWDAMSNFQEKLQRDEIRCDEKRFSIQKTWHQIDKSRACCCEAPNAWLQPIGAVFAPLYRL